MKKYHRIEAINDVINAGIVKGFTRENFNIIESSPESVQLELRTDEGFLLWRDFTFSANFEAGFHPYVK